MSGPVLAMAAVTVAVVAVVAVVVVRTTRGDRTRNVMLGRAHEERLARWAMAARSGRGDPPPRRAPLALPSGRETASGESGPGVSS